MSQESYDQGYEDGRKSRDDEVGLLKLELEWAKADRDSAREEKNRYKALWHATGKTDVVPF